jgi:predicted exporter
MKRTLPAFVLLAAWVGVLALLGLFVQRQLVLGADLRLFLPSPKTPEQKLLLEGIGEGPATRALVVALQGAEPERLADLSRALTQALHDSEHFQLVSNGEVSLDAVPEDLLPYRYVLSPTLDGVRFDVDYLRAQLQARARDFASPAGDYLETWLPRDPTLELVEVLERWQPMQEPRREYDVWFDQAGRRALLVAQTRAPAFDPDRQRAAIQTLEQTFRELQEDSRITMTVSGAGKFSVLMEERTRTEAQLLGTAATAGMVILLLVAYRRFSSIVLSALPLASAGLAGLAAVSAFFGTVHGITLAFGFTLIGVAQDYPIHLLSHRRPDVEPYAVARSLWPTLATGVASTSIAYLTFLFSGVIGLAQLACFTVAGLAVAGLSTRFLLPALLDPAGRDYGHPGVLDRINAAIERLPRARWVAALLVVLCGAGLAVAKTPFWENDLGRLTPVPEDLLIHDQELRSQLGTPDMRYMVAVHGKDDQAVLARLEQLDASLQALVERGAIKGFDDAARYVPTEATQRRRQSRLPDSAELRADLHEALKGTPFRPEVFEPFVEDVAIARKLQPLTVDRVRGTPLGAGIEMLMLEREGGTTGLITFSGVRNPGALSEWARAAGDDVLLLDLKDASESLVAHQRTSLLWSLALASLLLVGVIAFSLRDRSRVLRVLAPMALTTLIALAILRGTGVSLSMFHLIALILAAGLGLDYALFFEHASDDAAEQRRTLHAILVCSLSTLMVFALLGTSSLPVLRAIGVTVTIGVVSNFILALLLTRPAGEAHARP